MGVAHIRAILTAAVTWCLMSAPAAAHDLSFSTLDVRWNTDRVEMTLDLHRDDAVRLEPSSADGEFDRLGKTVAARIGVDLDGARLAPRFRDARAGCTRNRIAIELEAIRGPDANGPARRNGDPRLTLDWWLFPASDQHETYVTSRSDGGPAHRDILTAEHSRITIVGNRGVSASSTIARFVAEGIHHIFIGPDHILFIVGLVLMGGGARRIVKVATAFTIAHSITLALAALALVQPPSAVVEPLIALSIVYVGIDNLRPKRAARDWRSVIAFAFGLIHGFGFASVLRDVGLPGGALAWSLLGLNLGVEAGQAFIVLLIAPVLGLLNGKHPALSRRVVVAGSIAISLAGGIWFVQRVAAAFA